jgi:hypothetical protein
VILGAAVVAAILVIALPSGSHSTQRQMESILQDDQFLLYEPPSVIAGTLNEIKTLGVDRVRVTVLWLSIAPDPNATTRPRKFKARDPAAYPAAGWAPYDRLVQLAAARGIGVDFTLTAPGPLWAMAHPAPSAKFASHYRPSPLEFDRFVEAVGKRYSGSWRIRSGSNAQATTLPRVSYWTIWNEPNQPGWLAPQWRSVAGARVADSPRLYRAYVGAAFAGLASAGHRPSTDTILIGELAPEGTEGTEAENPIPPITFLRALYCVGANDEPLQGPAAASLDCPAGGSAGKFVAANPGLFGATGFAHHPYAFFLPPTSSMSDANFVPLADISRLEHALDRIFAGYGVHRQLPIYVTEYGYETNPPNPFRGVTLGTQAQYLDQAQYLAWKDPRIRSMAQFLLVDSAPNPRFPRGSIGYWSTFQTGLLFHNGAPKPSLAAYELPIVVPNPSFHAGAKVLVWAMLRAAPNGTTQHAALQWRPPHGTYRTLDELTTSDPSGFLSAEVNVPGTGALRLEWTRSRGVILHSRVVKVREAG